MTTPQKASPALQLVRLVFTEGQKATGHSWTRLNQALYLAARVAIEGGLRFDLEDFTDFHGEMRALYWIGAHPDGLYAAACKSRNRSACLAYEHHYDFAPYELDGQRVHVGHAFEWNGERVTCTSIQRDRMVACSYQYELDQHQHQRKVLWHRYSITPADLNAERKKREITVAGAKMQTARDAAKEHAQRCGIPDHVLALAVEDVSGGLMAYEQEELARVVKQRFKKSEKPTILDLLTVGHRWRGLAKDIAIIIAANVQRQSRGDMQADQSLQLFYDEPPPRSPDNG